MDHQLMVLERNRSPTSLTALMPRFFSLTQYSVGHSLRTAAGGYFLFSPFINNKEAFVLIPVVILGLLNMLYYWFVITVSLACCPPAEMCLETACPIWWPGKDVTVWHGKELGVSG